MKITVIIPRLTIAGVPLAQIRLAKAFSERGYSVDLIIGYIEKGSDLPSIEKINIIHFNKIKVRSMFFIFLSYLIKNKPNIIFSAEDHLNILITFAVIISFSKVKLSCSSRVTPYDTYSNKIFSKRWLLKYLNKLTSWRVNVLTCVSEEMTKQYYEVLNSKRYVCVYNIIDSQSSRKLMYQAINNEWLNNKNIKVIIAAGKLAYWKGFENLINAFSIVSKERDVKLIILGDGPQRSILEKLVYKLNLTNNVSLPGYVINPLSYFALSEVFVLSSIVEGMPNVLVEAMMCGCTPVSTNCPTGPKELLKNNKFGYLVPVGDKYAMSNAIIKALDQPISKELLEEAIKPFNENVIVNKHIELININR
tara:strand:- start:5627 stop:6718 length:1092 start_codon:yes stop_codon:yes gene_type:complete